MRELVKALRAIVKIMEPLSHDDQQSAAFEVWRHYGGGLSLPVSPSTLPLEHGDDPATRERVRDRQKKARKRARLRGDVPGDAGGTQGGDKRGDKGGTAPVVSTASEVPSSPTGVHQLLKYYEELFAGKFGRKPMIHSGKDPAILKRVLDTYGGDIARKLIEKFFEIDDEFVQKAGHSVGVFASVLTKLVERISTNGAQLRPRLAAVNDPWKGRSAGEVKL